MRVVNSKVIRKHNFLANESAMKITRTNQKWTFSIWGKLRATRITVKVTLVLVLVSSFHARARISYFVAVTFFHCHKSPSDKMFYFDLKLFFFFLHRATWRKMWWWHVLDKCDYRFGMSDVAHRGPKNAQGRLCQGSDGQQRSRLLCVLSNPDSRRDKQNGDKQNQMRPKRKLMSHSILWLAGDQSGTFFCLVVWDRLRQRRTILKRINRQENG